MFADRRAAGRLLADALLPYGGISAIVLGLPRGGVPVADEVARVLGATLDVWVARKIGVPFQPELGMGAIAEGPASVIDRSIVEALGITQEQIDEVTRRETAELARRVELFRHGRPAPELRGKTVILVDDGIATGGTMRAAIQGVKKSGAARIVIAVPVAAPTTIAALRDEVEQIVCLRQPYDLVAIGLWYEDFRQVSDEEVLRILDRWRGQHPAELQPSH